MTRDEIMEAVAAKRSLNGADLHGADLNGADLHGADLRGADLQGANLNGADLHGANLYCADLHGANLHGADLHGADLHGANLHRANLHRANLHSANLHGANLHGANLDDTTTVDTGETWAIYCGEVVPALLTAGGKPLEAAAAMWHCHSWDNCPLAAAFDTHAEVGVPLLLRPRSRQFLQFFDANLLPVPK